jgi:hypothetical protein
MIQLPATFSISIIMDVFIIDSKFKLTAENLRNAK